MSPARTFSPRPPAPLVAGDPPLAQDPIYYRPAATAPGVQLRELYDLLLRGKWIILGTMLAVLIPAAIHTFRQPDLYQAYALLLVDKQDETLADVLPTSGRSAFFRSERNLGNELLVLRQSLRLGDSAAARLMAYGRLPGTDVSPTILQVEDGERLSRDLVVARLQGQYISANLEGTEVDAIRITAVSTVPQEAALIANLYADAFVRRTQESSRAGYAASRQFLEEQVQRQASALGGYDDAVRQFMTREGAVALDQETQQLVGQLAAIQAQRDEAAVDAQMKQAEVNALEAELSAIEPRLVELLSSGAEAEIEQAQTRIAELEARLEQYYLRNPALRDAAEVPEAVRDLRGQIEQLRTRVRERSEAFLAQAVPAGAVGSDPAGVQRVADLRRQLAAARIALSGLQARQGVLARRVGEYERELGAIPTQAIDLARLQRQRMSTERLFSALEEKLQEARVAEQSQLGYAEIIRPALTPHLPFSPNRRRNLTLALLFGFGLGVALAIAKTRLDNRLHRPEDLRDRGYIHIGTVPDMEKLIKEDFQGKDTVTVDGHTLDTHLVALLNPMAVASESYRALRTNLQFCRPDVVVETIIVTSPSPGEGKSVSAANLAVVMAQAGRKTLLVDADLRRPTVHRKFGLTRQPGLVERLFSTTPLDPVEYSTDMENLFVMPAGATTPNPSELLGSKAMREFVVAAREAFDVIIFDAPPVLAATDAALLSTQCDATLLVVRAGQTHDYALDHAAESLGAVGASVVGIVLNGFDVSKAYGYRYKYAYRYGGTYAYGHDRA